MKDNLRDVEARKEKIIDDLSGQLVELEIDLIESTIEAKTHENAASSNLEIAVLTELIQVQETANGSRLEGWNPFELKIRNGRLEIIKLYLQQVAIRESINPVYRRRSVSTQELINKAREEGVSMSDLQSKFYEKIERQFPDEII